MSTQDSGADAPFQGAWCVSPTLFIPFGAGTPVLLEAPGGADALPVIFSLFSLERECLKLQNSLLLP